MNEKELWTQQTEHVLETDDTENSTRSINLRLAGTLHDIAQMQESSVNRVVNMLVEMGIHCFYDKNIMSPEMQILRTTAQNLGDFQLQYLFIRNGISLIAQIMKDNEIYSSMLKISQTKSISPADAVFHIIKFATKKGGVSSILNDK